MANARFKAMDAIFHPQSIAFVGASNNVNKWGFLILHNLIMGGYAGPIYPVNAKEKSVLGREAFPSLTAIPHPVDLAVFTIPAEKMPEALAECGRKKVRAGVVISAGLGELGERGARLEAEITALARRHGIVLVGPNCQGVACPESRLYPWMPAFLPAPGPIACISQSGNVQTSFGQGLELYGFGLSKTVSMGNAADLDAADYLDYLEHDTATRVIVLYLEGIGRGREFLAAARRVGRTKPIILIKSGRTEAGARAARSHTGALAGADQVLDAACRQAGVIRAATVEQAVLFSAAFSGLPLPAGRRAGIITGGGGLGVLAADACLAEGLDPAPLPAAAAERLAKILPPWWVAGNPVDLVAGLGYAGPLEIMPVLLDEGRMDGLILISLGWTHGMVEVYRRHSPLRALGDLEPFLQERLEKERRYCNRLGDLIEAHGKPIYFVASTAAHARERGWQSLSDLLGRGYLIFPTLESAVECFAAMARYRAWLEAEGAQEPARAAAGGG